MDKGKIQKIYSRRIPRIKYFKGNNEDNNDKQKIKKILKIIIVLAIDSKFCYKYNRANN